MSIYILPFSKNHRKQKNTCFVSMCQTEDKRILINIKVKIHVLTYCTHSQKRWSAISFAFRGRNASLGATGCWSRRRCHTRWRSSLRSFEYAPAVTRRKRIAHNSLPAGSSLFRFSAGVFRNSRPPAYLNSL